jgi:hypothetical protein
MSKPQLVFFKMMGCGHCVHFYQSPTLETSPWSQLVRDNELTSKVDFVLREWGISKNPDGTVENRKLPEEYKFVNYGPYFWLQNGQDSTQGFEFKDAPRTYEGMKKWILDKIQQEPKLTARAVSQAPQVRQAPTNIHSSTEQKNVPNHMKQIMNQRQVPVAQAAAPQQHQHHDGCQHPVQAAPQQQAKPSVQVQHKPIQQQVQKTAQVETKDNPEQVAAPVLHQNNTSNGIKRMVLKKQEEPAPTRKFIAKNHRKR